MLVMWISYKINYREYKDLRYYDESLQVPLAVQSTYRDLYLDVAFVS